MAKKPDDEIEWIQQTSETMRAIRSLQFSRPTTKLRALRYLPGVCFDVSPAAMRLINKAISNVDECGSLTDREEFLRFAADCWDDFHEEPMQKAS